MNQEDNFTPPQLNEIYFYLAQGCNLRCRHCWLAPELQSSEDPGPTLSVKLFDSIVDQGIELGMTGVKLTGGEPLLHPQIEDILTSVQNKNLNLTVETNGLLCTPKIAKLMSKCPNSHVSVSLDGADQQTHESIRCVSGSFEKAINGLKYLVMSGIKPQIIMSVMRCNYDQMESLVRLAESLGAGSVKFNIVQPTKRGVELHDSNETLTIQELVELGQWVEKKLTPSTNLPVYYDHPDCFRPLSSIYGKNGTGVASCGIHGILGVLADSTYALCGIGSNIPELAFGQADTVKLSKVWSEAPMLQEIRQGVPKYLTGICGDCLTQSTCLGSCIAQNYYRSKSLWAPYWYCEEADKAGLFPENRRRSSYINQ